MVANYPKLATKEVGFATTFICLYIFFLLKVAKHKSQWIVVIDKFSPIYELRVEIENHGQDSKACT
jgi:hypothetical protein